MPPTAAQRAAVAVSHHTAPPVVQRGASGPTAAQRAAVSATRGASETGGGPVAIPGYYTPYTPGQSSAVARMSNVSAGAPRADAPRPLPVSTPAAPVYTMSGSSGARADAPRPVPVSTPAAPVYSMTSNISASSGRPVQKPGYNSYGMYVGGGEDVVGAGAEMGDPTQRPQSRPSPQGFGPGSDFGNAFSRSRFGGMNRGMSPRPPMMGQQQQGMGQRVRAMQQPPMGNPTGVQTPPPRPELPPNRGPMGMQTPQDVNPVGDPNAGLQKPTPPMPPNPGPATGWNPTGMSPDIQRWRGQNPTDEQPILREGGGMARQDFDWQNIDRGMDAGMAQSPGDPNALSKGAMAARPEGIPNRPITSPTNTRPEGIPDRTTQTPLIANPEGVPNREPVGMQNPVTPNPMGDPNAGIGKPLAPPPTPVTPRASEGATAGFSNQGLRGQNPMPANNAPTPDQLGTPSPAGAAPTPSAVPMASINPQTNPATGRAGQLSQLYQKYGLDPNSHSLDSWADQDIQSELGGGQDVGAGGDVGYGADSMMGGGSDGDMSSDAPSWSPPGHQSPNDQWRYDLDQGWLGPGEKADPSGTQAVMGRSFDPRNRGKNYHILMSPPGQQAPPGALNYTPATRELHPPGMSAPAHETNLSLMAA